NALAGPAWNGWGVNASNTRYQDGAAAGFTAAQVPRLKLKWAFGFPGDVAADAQPTVVGGRVFVGSQSGNVYALSASTGCIHWYFPAAASVRAADEEEQGRYADVGTVGCAHLGEPGHRRPAQRDLRHHRRQLQRSRDHDQRRIRRVRPRHRENPLVPANNGGGCLEHRVPSAG